ncbi:hypothetical protein SDC9_21990 [bioreactor metagenome]|uniref:ArsA/GET3 Anion-transporting ATPase-like domain-containing protein n=1 Tax=bioreactor metagenome TaxID=1076179 RepID=A0A644UAX5_9ZZZZ
MKLKSTNNETIRTEQILPLNDVIEDLDRTGKKVHLTATHLKFVLDESSGITMSPIDEQAELANYQKEVLAKARETMSEADIAYMEEDLRSPCTQEIAIFRAFAKIVEKAEDQVVVIETAPTGHTLLLLFHSKLS